MRSSVTLAAIGLSLVVLAVLLSQVVLAAPDPAPTLDLQDYNLLVNPGLEAYDPAYGEFEGVPCQVATGWRRFWSGGAEPCWMDGRVFAKSHLGHNFVEHIEGETAQFIVSREPYSAGIWQQVAGLVPGLGYGFHHFFLTIYQTSAQDPVHDTIFKRVGVDPTGGTDPWAPTVEWSEMSGVDQAWDLDRRVAWYASSPTVTVFAQVISPYPSGDPSFLNLSILDSGFLAQTPVITATSPAASEVPTFTVSWDNAVAAPGLNRLRWRDVQWLDEAEGVWHDWITMTREVLSADFVGERAHAYRFRARVWQKYINGDHLYSPYRVEGDTRTFVRGARFQGLVMDPRERPLGDATAILSGTAHAAMTGYDGVFVLDSGGPARSAGGRHPAPQLAGAIPGA